MTNFSPVGRQPGAGTDLGDPAPNSVRDEVLDVYRWSMEHHEQTFCEDSLHYYKHWKNWVDARVSPDDYRSNIGVGIAYPIVEIVFSHLMEPWLSGNDIIKAHSEQEMFEDAAPRVSAFVNRKIINAPNAYQQHAMVKRAALITGRGILKPFMEYRRPKSVLQRVIDKVAGVRLGSRVMRQQSAPRPRMAFRCIDPFDWWKTPGSRSDYEWTFERYYLTTSQVHARVESEEWRELRIDVTDSDAIGYDQFRLRRMAMEQYLSDQVRSGMTSERPMHRVVEFQGRIPWKDTKGSKTRYRDMRVVVLNDDAIALAEDLRSKDSEPEYITWEPVQDPFSERPVGLIEPMEDILLEMNDYENIALDNARKVLESPLLVDPKSTKQDKLYLGPGEINWVRNPRASVAPLEMKDLPASFYHQIGFLNDLVQRITGVSDYFGGMNTADSGKLSKTATGMQLMANLSATRFGPLIASLDHDYYRKIAMWVQNAGDLWQSGEETFRTGGDPANPYMTVTPEDLSAEVVFTFTTKALDPKTEERRQNFVRMVEQINMMAPQMQQFGTHYVDYYELAKVLLDEFDHLKDIDKIIKLLPQAPGMGAMGPTAGMINPGAMQPGAFGPPGAV